MVVTKSIVANLNKMNKLNVDNYDLWHHKIHHVLQEKNLIEVFVYVPKDLCQGSNKQSKRDNEACLGWKKKDD